VELVSEIQTELINQFGHVFAPYTLDQIHATLVGLEGYRTESGLLNSNLIDTVGAPRPMDLEGLFHFLMNTPILPLNIRIGGFRRSEAYFFTSRGQHPYNRSFTLSRREAVVIGWPVNNNKYPMSLDHLRRCCIVYNVQHKYHQAEGDIDNDLFLVLGRLRQASITPDEYAGVQSYIRELLSSRQSLDLAIGVETLSVVAYEDRSLPTHSSYAYPLPGVLDRFESLTGFYEQK
jgi:hypothetical protein